MITDGVRRSVLDNGLTVLLKESRRAPVATFWVWYRVGSRNEGTGHTGISHWVEHMMFRGTERFPRGAADRLVARVGGYHNALTYLDWTAYFQTLPAQHLALALEVESDRMVNAQFAAEDAELERTVIISERQGAENFPGFLLQEELGAAAFKAHPYGHMVIGWLSDLQSITRDELYGHYRTFYGPGNAIIAAVGDFDQQVLLHEIEQRFGGIPARPPVPPVRGLEPEQRGERRVQVIGPGDTDYLSMAFPAPAAGHPDFFPLAVVDTLLGGARSLALFDASEPKRTSRLYRALVDSGLAAEASCYLLPSVDPYLFTCSATLQVGSNPQLVEQVLLRELERLASEPVSQPELDGAVRQTQAQFVYSAESVTNQGYWLGFAEVVADLPWLAHFTDSLAAVTADDVQRVAAHYLAPRRRTVGWYKAERDV